MNKFVIGIGSQRAGSTLLHTVLSKGTEIFMHPVKELHYYDTLYGVRKPEILKEFSKKQLYREIDNLINNSNYDYIDKNYKAYVRANKILSTKSIKDINYLDLYRPCLKENYLIGETTPEYMILPDQAIKRMSTDLGKDAKIILITRNPVDRFISAFKLLKTYNKPLYQEKDYSSDIVEVFETMPDWIAQQKKFNEFKSAEKKFKKYFDDIIVLNYEELVDNPIKEIKNLEEYLGVKVNYDIVTSSFGKKVNSIGETGHVSLDVQKLIEDNVCESNND